MEAQVIETLVDCVRTNTPVALVTVISNSGSSPGKTGAMMTVKQDRKTSGTIGGGNLEYRATSEAVDCLTSLQHKEVSYRLKGDDELGMTCGGDIRIFIKVFQPKPRLVIIGAGHIGLELYRLGIQLGFGVEVIDDRAEMLTEQRFPQAKRIIAEDLVSALDDFALGKDCYVTIATSSHNSDRRALHAVIQSGSSYIGMIGSSNKIRTAFTYLLDQGVSQEKVKAVYAPMGLNIASIHPREIAMSIISEILLIKNSGSPHHMRTIKNIKL